MVSDLKWNYNRQLGRYYNGCNYITENPEQFDKYFPKVMEIKEELEVILTEIEKEQTITTDEILGGFKLC